MAVNLTPSLARLEYRLVHVALEKGFVTHFLPVLEAGGSAAQLITGTSHLAVLFGTDHFPY